MPKEKVEVLPAFEPESLTAAEPELVEVQVPVKDTNGMVQYFETKLVPAAKTEAKKVVGGLAQAKEY